MTIQVIRPADRAAWLAARSQDVTASVAGALLSVHPYTTAYTLWAIKTGRVVEDDEDNPVLRRGRLLEPVAIEMLREDRPDWTVTYDRSNTYWRDPEARLGATPDAFGERPDIYGTGVIQVKTASDHAFRDNWRDPETGEAVLPLWIAVQAIVEAELTGATWASVALMVIGRGIELHVIDVPLHAGVKRRLRAAVREFWRMADAGEEPPVDWHRDGAAVMEVWRDTVPDRRDLTGDETIDGFTTRLVDARSTRSSAERIINEMTPRIVRALGTAEEGFTANWIIRAPTTVRTGRFGEAVKSRVLKVKPRENPHADHF